MKQILFILLFSIVPLSWAEEGSDELVFPFEVYPKVLEPNAMLKELKVLAKDSIDAWIHTAAVLDYLVSNPAAGKIASQQGSLKVELIEGEKHIESLKES